MIQNNENPKKILSDLISDISEGVKNRKHPFHIATFSNIDNKQNINSRIVVIRNYNPIINSLNFHSDIRSKKVQSITEIPETYFVFYDPNNKIQIRLQTKSIIHHNNNITLKNWEKTKLSSRKCYLTEKAPSSKTNLAEDGIPSHLIGKDPDKEASEAGYKNFALVNNKINSIEWLYLSYTGHRRLRIDINGKKIEYQWLIP